MAKNDKDGVKAMGFSAVMFRIETDADFDTYIDAVIDEQSVLLNARIGSTAYDSKESPVKEYVKNAEKSLIAAEMITRRINIVLGNITGKGQEIDTKNEERQREAYTKAANDWIEKALSAMGDAAAGGIASGVVITPSWPCLT